jgi:hypothetical protein
MTDFRALCAELLDALENAISVIRGEGGTKTKHISTADAVITKADAALAQPEPQGPTQAELRTFACKWWRSFGFVKNKATCTWVIDQIAPEHFVDFSRDLLARWGRLAIEPVPGVQGEP